MAASVWIMLLDRDTAYAANLATQRRHDAGRECLVEPKRVANCHGFLTNLQNMVGRGSANRLQVWWRLFDTKNRNILGIIGADHFGGVGFTGREA